MASFRAKSATAAARVAGPLLGSIFTGRDWDAFQHPEGKVPAGRSIIGPLASHLEAHVDGMPQDPVAWQQMQFFKNLAVLG